MPRRTDLKKILLVGSGPIVIGQACEFDYSGTQGAKALQEEGYEVVLVNSNPATVMTDPEFADRTYVEPLDARRLSRPSSSASVRMRSCPTLGRPDGAEPRARAGRARRAREVRRRAHRRERRRPSARPRIAQLFKDAMEKIGLRCPQAPSWRAPLEEAYAAVEDIGLPGDPAALASRWAARAAASPTTKTEFDAAIRWAFQQSPTHECLVEESVLGWKEYELEVIRDRADNFIVICTHRELRSDGRAHGRLDHGRARA